MLTGFSLTNATIGAGLTLAALLSILVIGVMAVEVAKDKLREWRQSTEPRGDWAKVKRPQIRLVT